MAGASEEGQVIGCHTIEAWTEQLQKGNESKKLVRIHLYSFLFLFLYLHGSIDLNLCYDS